MKTYLFRHGAVEYNVRNLTQSARDDQPLLPESVIDTTDAAYEAIKTIEQPRLIIVYSPTLRTRQTCSLLATAAIMAKKTVHCVQDRDLREVDFGDFSGMPEDAVIDNMSMQSYRDEIQHMYEVNKFGDLAFPNGENVLETTSRAMTLMNHWRGHAPYIYGGDDAFTALIFVGHNRIFRHMRVLSGDVVAKDMFAAKLPHTKLVPFSLFDE